jgi:hypothetical protein
MPTTDLDTLRDRVEALLTDASNAEWSTGELDNAIRLALYELSAALPVRAAATKDAVDEAWEYDLSAISGLVSVVEVWYPYLSTSDTYKRAHPVKFRMLTDAVLLIEVADTPDDAYDLRIFYDKVQTLGAWIAPQQQHWMTLKKRRWSSARPAMRRLARRAT